MRRNAETEGCGSPSGGKSATDEAMQDRQMQIRYDMTGHEMRLLELLRHGRQSARSVSFLSEQTGLSSVEVRRIVKHLVEEHNIMIVSAVGSPAGYYYPVTNEEYMAGVKQLENRIISLAKRLRAINRQAYERIFGQMRIEDVHD